MHPRTAIIPATVVAILVTDAGMAYLRAMLTGQVSLEWGSGPALLWSVWGVALVLPLSPTTCAAAAPAATATIMNRKPPCRLLAAVSSLRWAEQCAIAPVEGSILLRLPGADITQERRSPVAR